MQDSRLDLQGLGLLGIESRSGHTEMFKYEFLLVHNVPFFFLRVSRRQEERVRGGGRSYMPARNNVYMMDACID